MRAFPALAGGIMVMGLAALPLLAGDAKEAPKRVPLQMSISTTLFDGLSARMQIAVAQPLSGLLKAQTGIDGELVAAGDGLGIAGRLEEGKVHVAVMEGIEFAWARQKYPELCPLMIAVNQKAFVRSYIVVRKGGAIQQFADLKGKRIADCPSLRICSRLFVARLCRDAGRLETRQFFAEVARADSVEDMLDDLIDGKVEAAIVEEVCFDCYQRRKPGRARNLHVLEQSEKFPPSVVAFRKGRLEQATLTQLKSGMLDAGSSLLGRQLMTLWRMTAFQDLPDAFEPTLKDIVKAYPPPPSPAKNVAVSGGGRGR